MVTIAITAAWFWAVAAHDPEAMDGQYQQPDKIDSGGEDAWLSSLTH
jgi:hypothetical protein